MIGVTIAMPQECHGWYGNDAQVDRVGVPTLTKLGDTRGGTVMGRCRCGGCVVFGTFPHPLVGAALLGCRECGNEWLDNGERCTVGLTSNVPKAWCPQCGSAKTLVVTQAGG